MRKKLTYLIVTDLGLLSLVLPTHTTYAMCFLSLAKVGYEGSSDHNQAMKNK